MNLRDCLPCSTAGTWRHSIQHVGRVRNSNARNRSLICFALRLNEQASAYTSCRFKRHESLVTAMWTVNSSTRFSEPPRTARTSKYARPDLPPLANDAARCMPVRLGFFLGERPPVANDVQPFTTLCMCQSQVKRAIAPLILQPLQYLELLLTSVCASWRARLLLGGLAPAHGCGFGARAGLRSEEDEWYIWCRA